VSKFRAAGWGDFSQTRASKTKKSLCGNVAVEIIKLTCFPTYLLAAYHNKHCWWVFRRYQHRWAWTTLKPKTSWFLVIFAILGCEAHLESEFLLKLLETICIKLNWCCRASHEHYLDFFLFFLYFPGKCLDLYKIVRECLRWIMYSLDVKFKCLLLWVSNSDVIFTF